MEDIALKRISKKGVEDIEKEIKELSLKFFVNPDVVLIIYMSGMHMYQKLFDEYLQARKQSKQKE